MPSAILFIFVHIQQERATRNESHKRHDAAAPLGSFFFILSLFELILIILIITD
jgi:flagellar biogenesis protein FliO